MKVDQIKFLVLYSVTDNWIEIEYISVGISIQSLIIMNLYVNLRTILSLLLKFGHSKVDSFEYRKYI